MIILWNSYVIDADKYQFILGTLSDTVDKKTGLRRETLDNATYYPTIHQALLSFHDMMLREGIQKNTHTIMSAIALSKQIESRIRALAIRPDSLSLVV